MLRLILKGFRIFAVKAVPPMFPATRYSHLLRCLVGALGLLDGRDVLYLLSIWYGEELLLGVQEQLLLMRKDELLIHTLKVLHRVRDRLVALRLHTLILPRLRILLLRLLCRLLMLGLIKTILLHHNFLSCMLYLLRWLFGHKLLFLL